MFIDNAVWAICSTYHTVLKASPGAAIFGRDMLFDTGIKLETIDNARLIAVTYVKMMNVLTTITKLVRKY